MAGPAAGGPVRKKIVHHLGSPFTSVSWPEISQEDQDTILELLCEYLSPIGKHRQRHIKPSKGKRAEKKRKRQEKDAVPDTVPMVVDPPPKPEIASQVDVGFNSITSELQNSASVSNANTSSAEKKDYSIIFVCRGNQTAAFNSHFPQMVAALSRDAERDQATRLVGFSKPCSDRLSSSLGIARVSSVAIHRDAAGSSALWDLVKKSVEPVRCEWLEEARSLQYRQSKIVSMETSVGPKKSKAVAAQKSANGARQHHTNDKSKLADAIALAKSFSRAKPAGKSKGKARPRANSFGQGRQLRGATRQQLTQSIVRTGAINAAAHTSHRQPPQQFHGRRQSTMSMAAWQGQKGVPSITGGRGLDFLSRKDADSSVPPVQSAPAVQVAVPPPVPQTAQVAPETPFGPTTATSGSDVMAEFLALMSQHEKEMAQVDPLVDKMKQWNLQSPVLAKPKPIIAPAVVDTPPAIAALQNVPNKTLGAVTQPKVLEPSIATQPIIAAQPNSSSQAKTTIDSKVVAEPKTPAPSKGVSETRISTPSYVTAEPKAVATTVKLPLGDISTISPTLQSVTKSARLFESSEINVHLPPASEPKKKVTSPLAAIEQLVRPPRTPESAKCNCVPNIKPQKGLSTSRFASKESEGSSFANKFSVNLQIVIHQDFCPLYVKQNGSGAGKGKDTTKVQLGLRADAMPFAPSRK